MLKKLGFAGGLLVSLASFAGQSSKSTYNVVNPKCCAECANNGNPEAIACMMQEKQGQGVARNTSNQGVPDRAVRASGTNP